MIIAERRKAREFSDQVALDRCIDEVRTAITYVLGWVGAAAPAGLDEEAKHRTIMQQLQGMPTEMLDKTYNPYRMENNGINLDEHPEYRTYQTFYELGIAPTPPPRNGRHHHPGRRCIKNPRLTGNNSLGPQRVKQVSMPPTSREWRR